jgi:arylsulfatase A-like enzyme
MDPRVQGNDYIETPHLDRLAREGLVGTQGYAAAGNGMPSRAALLSGQYSPRPGVYAVQSTERGRKAKMRLMPPGLDKENVTIPAAQHRRSVRPRPHAAEAMTRTGMR